MLSSDFLILTVEEFLAMALYENSPSEFVDEVRQHLRLGELTRATITWLSAIYQLSDLASMKKSRMAGQD
jgi:hypothetical protein